MSWWSIVFFRRIPSFSARSLERMDVGGRLWRWYGWVDWWPAIVQANHKHYPDKCQWKSPCYFRCLGIGNRITVAGNCRIVAIDLYLWCFQLSEYFGFCGDFAGECRVFLSAAAVSYNWCTPLGLMHWPLFERLRPQTPWLSRQARWSHPCSWRRDSNPTRSKSESHLNDLIKSI